MGFDNLIFFENLDDKYRDNIIRQYVSDYADYNFIIDWFTEKKTDSPQFLFNITMQNHGGYETEDFKSTVHLTGDYKGKFPRTEEYLSLIKYSDEAIAELLEFFSEYDEPVIVLIFGDHQPGLETEFYEYVMGTNNNELADQQKALKYKTPFIIWHNYDTEYQDVGDISLNYLASILLDDAGIPLTEYQQYVLKLSETYPVISGIGILDKYGDYYLRDSYGYDDATYDYRMLIYNHTIDVNNCIQEFFN
jgi:hypothetical protein